MSADVHNDVALLNGGANDADFDVLLNGSQNQGTFVSMFKSKIQDIFFNDTYELLKEARARMPNAVILLFGYYPGFSYQTNLGDLESYFKHEKNDDVMWYLNSFAGNLGLSGGPLINVDRAVRETRVRSVWGHGLATYWQRKAVTDANRNNAIRGPGIVFVPCGFRPNDSAFTTRDTLVHSTYMHPATDSMQKIREPRIPRVDALRDLQLMLMKVTRITFDAANRPVVTPNYKGAKALRAKINGPTSLKQVLFSRKADAWGREPARLLAEEIGRIKRGLIASFLHPNRPGHQQYANMTVDRYKAHLEAIKNLPRRGPHDFQGPVVTAPVGPESLEDRLIRFGLRGPGPLEADVGHEFVDAIWVTVRTDRSSDRNFAPDLFLRLVLMEAVGGHQTTVNLQLNMQYHKRPDGTVQKFHPQLEPNLTDDFSVDVSRPIRTGGVLLKDLIGMKLVVGDWPTNQTWRPQNVEVDINGVHVLTRNLQGKKLGPGTGNFIVDLDYPPPPVQAPTVLRPARPLAGRVASRVASRVAVVGSSIGRAFSRR